MKRYFVTGIGTEVGKTVVSAILCKAWDIDYWKPIQAGDLQYTDSDKVRDLIEGTSVEVHPEAFRLNSSMSPHAAAKKDDVEIGLDDLVPPETSRGLLIEGAGGLMVPVNEKGDMMVDLIEQFQAEVILVSRNFLGSINQTLLSCELLKSRNIPFLGIIFNGPSVPESEKAILDHSGVTMLGRVGEEEEINTSSIDKYLSSFTPGL